VLFFLDDVLLFLDDVLLFLDVVQRLAGGLPKVSIGSVTVLIKLPEEVVGGGGGGGVVVGGGGVIVLVTVTINSDELVDFDLEDDFEDVDFEDVDLLVFSVIVIYTVLVGHSTALGKFRTPVSVAAEPKGSSVREGNSRSGTVNVGSSRA